MCWDTEVQTMVLTVNDFFPQGILNNIQGSLAVTQEGISRWQRCSRPIQCTGERLHQKQSSDPECQLCQHWRIRVKEYLSIYICLQIFPYNIVTLHISARKIREHSLATSHWSKFDRFLGFSTGQYWRKRFLANFSYHILSCAKFYVIGHHFDLPVIIKHLYIICPFFYHKLNFK